MELGILGPLLVTSGPQRIDPRAAPWHLVLHGGTAGAADHALGLLRVALGDGDGGRAHLRVAEGTYRRAEARAWLAICLADLSERAGDPDEAADAAAEATSIAEEIGAPNVARRARAALFRRSPERAGPGGDAALP